MSTSRDRVRQALSHQGSDRIPVDFGATAVTRHSLPGSGGFTQALRIVL